ncbi:MAG: S-adenosylmethionine:tRNA ribosyltransferase-isomerase [Chitinophagaceae bacterium]|nr:S-adenosylmethionine:tRNA ribosyltransferase-isomerase [Chitinophagaceae bacterium]
MTDPRLISINDYTYSLPEERIASFPLTERDASKLLICKEGNIAEDTYRNIASHVPDNSLLVFNNTKVMEARLLFTKETGGVIEIFCLEPHEQYPDVTTAMLQKEKVWWHCLVGGASKCKQGQLLNKRVIITGITETLQAKYIEKRSGSFIIELLWSQPELSFAEILHYAGAIPLPPYIKRAAVESDAERYQTVYAHYDGSVAAPTAGLHFTEKTFSDFRSRNILTDFITLHVGAGTFKPVKSETIKEHEMHAEWIDVSKPTIENILSCLNKKIIAVGTTSLRTLESLYWLGTKKSVAGSQEHEESNERIPQLFQWEAYELAKKEIPVTEALQSLLLWMNKHQLDRIVTKTQILIAPGYEFKIANGLITNFHQPQSTLLLLVAALIGDKWKEVYQYAIENDFRFLSYGDGSLLWKAND